MMNMHDQYFIDTEQKLFMEAKGFATAIFLLIASHYIFNLSYHPKVQDIMRLF